MPKLRHLGHCRELASLSQSTPRHFLFVGGSSAMVLGGPDRQEGQAKNGKGSHGAKSAVLKQSWLSAIPGSLVHDVPKGFGRKFLRPSFFFFFVSTCSEAAAEAQYLFVWLLGPPVMWNRGPATRKRSAAYLTRYGEIATAGLLSRNHPTIAGTQIRRCIKSGCLGSGLRGSDIEERHFAGSVSNFTMGKRQKIVVIGAGPVGSLAALYAASRGDDVEIYELRSGELFSSTLGMP